MMLMGLAFAAMIVVEGESWAVLPIQVAFAVSFGAWVIGALSRTVKLGFLAPFRLVDYFVSMQVALLCGYFKYLGGDLKGAWERTTRR